MGWAFCVNAAGREVGYGIEAICDEPGCEAEIDRGLDYVCGGMHDGGEHGCGRYFCGSHTSYGWIEDEPATEQLCATCKKSFEDDNA